MPAPFHPDEYNRRLTSVRAAMDERQLDVLIVGDPANMNWLTGFDAWSFYVPQVMCVVPDGPPVWIGREMDAGAVGLTTHLDVRSVVPYPEALVQRDDTHPSEFMASWLHDVGLGDKHIGYESDSYFFSPRALSGLQSGLPDARWSDADRLVNWIRTVKSQVEVDMLAQAAAIAGHAMQTAWDLVKPGGRQCDLAAEIMAAQIRGTEDFGGDQTAICPLILAGEGATTAHPLWTDECFAKDQTVAFEIGGTRKRYNAGLARTVHLGKPPVKLTQTLSAVNEGLDAVLGVLKAGVTAGTVHRAWQDVLDLYGLEKPSRIGYSIGVGYPPDWGERTISLRAGEQTAIPQDAVLHVMLGMWLDGWGMEMSETVHITSTGCKCLTHFPRELHIVD